MTESIEKHLNDSEFFAELAPEFIEFLARHARIRRLDRGHAVFRYGEQASHFYLVTEGHITVEVAALEGPPLELQELGPGAVVGWSWLISPHRWHFQARAKTPAEVVEFDGEAVLAQCEANPRFGYELLKRFSALMSERLSVARRKMMQAFRPPGIA